MHLTAAALALLTGGALAFPFTFPFPSQQKTFSISVGRRNDITIPEIEHILQKRANGQGPIKFGGLYWVVNATVGGQPLQWTVDTGSSVSWALSPNTSATQNSGQLIYDPFKSSTATRLVNETFNIIYGDGTVGVNGNGWNDQICVGAACTTSNIGVAQNITGFQPGSLKSGIFGLSFGAASAYSPKQLPTFMEVLQKSLAAPVFVTNFRTDNTGTLDFGYVNASLYNGTLSTVPMDNSTGFWQANNVAYYAGGKQLGGNLSMIFDTGSPVIQVSNATINAYFAQVPNAKYSGNKWTYPCANQSSLPEFQLRFPNGAIGRIPGPNLQWYNADGTNCVSWFQATTGTGTIGDSWFNSNIVVFNQSAPSLSFAPKKF